MCIWITGHETRNLNRVAEAGGLFQVPDKSKKSKTKTQPTKLTNKNQANGIWYFDACMLVVLTSWEFETGRPPKLRHRKLAQAI